MKLWSAFYPDLLPELPGVPLLVLDQWIRNVSMDFCERTKAYVADLDPVSSVALQMAYSPVLPDNTTMVEILEVSYNGEPIDAKTRAALQREFGRWEAETGTPQYWHQQRADQVMLVPAPEVALTDGINIKAALKPSEAATGIEDWVFDKWKLKICAGVKAFAMSLNTAPSWLNPAMAEVNAGIYEAAVSAATSAASDGYSRKSAPRYSGRYC